MLWNCFARSSKYNLLRSIYDNNGTRSRPGWRPDMHLYHLLIRALGNSETNQLKIAIDDVVKVGE